MRDRDQDSDRTAGHAADHDDAALGLSGAPRRDDERALQEEGETGSELGDRSLGSHRNAARRADAFNVPGQGRDQQE